MINLKKLQVHFSYLLWLSIFIISCEQQIILPKVCDLPPHLGFNTIIINVETDTTTVDFVKIDQFGVINCDNFIIKQSNIKRNAKLGGTICGDGNFTISILYNDTANNSKLNLQGHYNPNIVTGNFYYCPNLTDTTFTNIGFINVNAGSGVGDFVTPLFSGQVHCSLNKIK